MSNPEDSVAKMYDAEDHYIVEENFVESRIVGSNLYLSSKDLKEMADTLLGISKKSHTPASSRANNNLKEDLSMAKTPVGGVAPALTTTQTSSEFDPKTVKFMNLGSAATRGPTSQFVEATTKVVLSGDALKRLVKIATACIEQDKGFAINVYPNERLSPAQAKYFNASAKVNVEHLESEGIISRADVYAD